MAKKRGSSGGFSFLGCFFIFAILVFAGIGIAFYLLFNDNPFVTESNSQATSVVTLLNPDVTQIPATNAPITPDNAPNNQTFLEILNDMNSTRQNAGLAPVRLNSLLNNAAAQQAAYTASIFDPKHEDASGNQADVRVSEQGYAWRRVGENLLSNWSIDGHEVFALWQSSSTHNANLINPDFSEIGLAYMVTPIGQVYHAMVLARPS